MSFYTKTKWTKYLRTKRYQNLAEMIFDTIKHHGKRPVMRWFGEDDDTIESITYNELEDYIITAFHGLVSLGYRKGDHISICAKTSRFWAWADIGMQCLGVTSVAIYPSLKPKEVLYIVKDSESKGIFVDDQENLKKFYKIWNEVPDVKYVIVFEKFDESLKRENVFSWEEFFEAGKKHRIDHPNLLKESISKVEEEDIATLIYTSGTTGVPKGVMLTQKNLLSDIVAVSAIAITLDKGQRPWDAQSITYMPYAHSFGRTVEEYGLIFNSSVINYVSQKKGQSLQEALAKAFQKFKPTLMVGVPYLYQKLYEKIVDTVATYPEKVQKIFNKAVATGKEYYTNILHQKKNPLGLRLKYAIFKKLVLGRIQKEMGGELLLMVTASAAISVDLLLFFWSCGFNIAEGYGLTEAAPATHYSRTLHNSDFRPNFHKKIDIYEKVGTVGPLLNFPGNPYGNMEQKLSPDGELLIRGPNIMKGYWKKSELTKAALDEEGWLHTGDLAKIDEDGYVKIIGRSKAIVKLYTGKMISPALIEGYIVPYSRIVAQIIFVGQEKKFLSAIVVPYQQPLKKYADEHSIPYNNFEDIIRNKEVHQIIKKDIMSFIEEDVAEFSQPKRFLISCKHFGEDEGFLTPTLKFKRNKIYADFANWIDMLYEQDEEFLIIEERICDFYDQSILM
ncbi:MAG: AMP-dependent synthetase/ligase [Promethearchaeota archaeon]